MMIWPHINAFYANGCAENNIEDEFYRELFNMATLAMKMEKAISMKYIQ